MDQRLCEQIEEAVKRFAEEQQDQKVFFHMLRQQQAEDGLGTDDHPSALTHMKLSQELTDVINQSNLLRSEKGISNRLDVIKNLFRAGSAGKNTGHNSVMQDPGE